MTRLVRRLFHSHGTVVPIVMERSSQQSWNDSPNSFPCRLITKDVFVEKIVIVIAITSEHNGNAFLLLLRDELCAVNVSVVAAKQQKQQKCKKKGRKITIIVTKKPYNDAVSAPFSKRLSPWCKVNTLINRYLTNQGDSDKRFAIFINN